MTKTTKKKTKNPQKGILFHLGNLFILLSLVMSFIIFYPVVSVYLFPPQIKSQEELNGNYITIPKINAQAPLNLNIDPWNELIYQKSLKTGVAHAKGTFLPGEKGRSFIFAHSSGNPLEQTRYNTIFFRLGDLKHGDLIEIKREGKVYKYRVTQTKVVWPSEITYLKKSNIPGIVVQTCWPIGTSLKRLLVFASPVQ